MFYQSTSSLPKQFQKDDAAHEQDVSVVSSEPEIALNTCNNVDTSDSMVQASPVMVSCELQVKPETMDSSTQTDSNLSSKNALLVSLYRHLEDVLQHVTELVPILQQNIKKINHLTALVRAIYPDDEDASSASSSSGISSDEEGSEDDEE